MDKDITVIIADDHPIFRKGLRQMLNEEDNIKIIGEADNGKKALEMIIDKKPDIAILDIDMPRMTGLEVLKELKEKYEIKSPS